MNLVELAVDQTAQKPAPCRFGNVVEDHACYCHSTDPSAPRKCPIWRNFGTSDLTKWKKGSWDDGFCPLFVATPVQR